MQLCNTSTNIYTTYMQQSYEIRNYSSWLLLVHQSLTGISTGGWRPTNLCNSAQKVHISSRRLWRSLLASLVKIWSFGAPVCMPLGDTHSSYENMTLTSNPFPAINCRHIPQFVPKIHALGPYSHVRIILYMSERGKSQLVGAHLTIKLVIRKWQNNSQYLLLIHNRL